MNFSPGNLLMNNRTRILDVFEKWLSELDAIQNVDFQRATVCLLHIARIMEDAGQVAPSNSVLDEEDDRFDITLVRIVLEDFSEVAYNAFRHMVATTDVKFQNACARFMIIVKLSSRELSDLFSEVFPSDELEDFLKEQINHSNELFRSRVAFLMGEMLLEEKNIPDIPIESILGPRLQRLKEIRLILENRHDEIIGCMKLDIERSNYANSASIPIPEPDSPTSDSTFWGTDECDEEGSTLYYIAVLNGLLHIASALIEFSEALAIAVSENLISECIGILKLPSIPVQTFALVLIGNSMLHRKLAVDFVEMEGPQELYKLIDVHSNGPTGDFHTFSSHATFIFQCIFKHSVAVDLLVKPTNASHLVRFMFGLFNNWDSLGTNLNILEWCADAIDHPLLLKEIHKANVWRKVKSVCDELLRMRTSEEKRENMFFLDHSRAVVALCLKYIVANMFWGYQYSKSLFSESDDLKPLNKTFGTLIRKNYIGTAGAVDIVQALSSSPSVIKIDDNEMYSLEAYMFKSLIRTGHLPKGMTIDLFGGEAYSSTNTNSFISSSFPTNNTSNNPPPTSAFDFMSSVGSVTASDMDLETQSVVSMVTKVFPEWTVAAAAIRENVIPALFQIIMLEFKDSTTVCLALVCLQLLCIDAATIVEIMQYDVAKYVSPQIIQDNVDLSHFQNKKGLEILLDMISTQERRDPSVTVGVLRLLAAMSAAPYFRYNGTDNTVAHGFFEEYMKSPYFTAAQQLAAEKKKPFDTAKKQILSKLAYNPLENVQRSVRKSVRAHAGISLLTQLLYYKKNMAYSLPIRLEAIKIMLGLQQDDDIKQILVKLRLPTILENQIQAEKSQTNMYDLNTLPQKFQDKALLQFYTDNLMNLLRGFPVYQPGHDTGLSILDDAQEHMMRKSVVDHSNIDFSQFELLYLIRDHLTAMGLNKSALTLENELIEREQQFNDRNKFYGMDGTSASAKVAGFNTQQPSLSAKLSRQNSIERRLNFMAASSTSLAPGQVSSGTEGNLNPSGFLPSGASTGSKKRFRDALEEESRRLEQQHIDSQTHLDELDTHSSGSGKEAASSSVKRLSVVFASEATNNNGSDRKQQDDDMDDLSPPPLKYSTSAKKPANNNNSSSSSGGFGIGSSAKKAFHNMGGMGTTVVRSLHPVLPVAKSQRRKNIIKALKSDSCGYASIPRAPLMTDAMPTSASDLSPATRNASASPPTLPPLENAHAVTASRTAASHASSSFSSSSSSSMVRSSFVTPSISRHGNSSNHHHHYPSHSHNVPKPTQKQSHYYLPTVDAPTPFASTQSKLSSIMRRYLRLQHCQCKHPVSTLPLMSLQKPHSCAKPPPLQFYNINRIVHRYEPVFANVHWMQQHRYEVAAGRLQHLYSSYRTVMTHEEEGYMITACAFGQQSHRLWLAWYDYDNGAEVTMVDTHTQDTLGEAYDLELPGMIDSFVFPEMVHASGSLPDLAQAQQPVLCAMVQSHMITSGQALGKELYLYRDRDSVEVFQSPALQKLTITQDDLRHLFSTSQPGYSVPADIVDDDLTSFESAAFSRGTSRYLAASIVNDVIPMGAGFVFDVETGTVIHRLLNEASSGGGPTYEFPQVHYMPDEDHILLLDGKLYDLRTNQALHRFDKLSRNGNAVFHPTAQELIIDSAVWDLRMFGLRQTVPLLEHCRVQFDKFGGGLIAAMSMKDDDRMFADIREEYLGFHVLHPTEYSHIHTKNVVKAGQVSGYGLAEVQVDRNGGGLIAGILLAGAQEATTSQCKVLEIGLRKRTVDDDANDGDEDSDEDDEWQGSSSSGEEEDEEEDDEEDGDEEESEDEEEDDVGHAGNHPNGVELDDDENDDDDDDDEEDEDWETDDGHEAGDGDSGDDDHDGDNDHSDTDEPMDEDSDGFETVSEDDDSSDGDDNDRRSSNIRTRGRGNATATGRQQHQHAHLPTRRGPYSRR